MTPFSDDPDFLDLIAVWHENREFPEDRKAALLERLCAEPELRRDLAREIQMAALTDTVQKGETSWLRLEEKLAPGEDLDAPPRHEEAIMARISEADVPRSSATPAGTAPATRSTRSGHARKWWLGIAAAAALLVVGLSLLPRQRSGSPATAEASVAKVLRIDGTAQTNGGRTLTSGDLLRAGEKLSMPQGLVEMAFIDTGVHLVATAPLAFTANSKERIFVHDGEVKLHVPPQGIGFIVETLERRFTDLGTSFVVTAGEEGSEVLVLDGQIAVGDRDGGAEKMMFEGDLANFDRDGAIKLRSRGASGVPERSIPPGGLTATSLRGELIAFEPSLPTAPTDADVIGARLLPLVRSGFQDEACLTGMKRIGPLRFAGIAGAYRQFPRAVGLEPYDEALGWLAWYRGKCAAPQPGRYRFWGYADNHLLVSIDGRPVFEGSRYSSSLREDLEIPRRNHPSLPCLNSTAGLASGEWFEVGDDPVRLDLLFGEQGGRLTSGLLMIEREGGSYEETFWGQPKWPLFLTEAPMEMESIELEKLRHHMEEKLVGSFSTSGAPLWKIYP